MTKLIEPSFFHEAFQINVDQYHAMIDAGTLGPADKVELLYGKILPMSPVGRFHAASVARISKLFFRNFSDRYSCRAQDPISILPVSEPEPDFVVAKFDEEDYVDGHPTPRDILLLIEVSDSTLDKDRKYKLPLYASSGIQEYWIVNLVDRQIELYSKPSEVGTYGTKTIIEEGKVWSSPTWGDLDTSIFLPRITPVD